MVFTFIAMPSFAQISADGVWLHIPKTKNRQALYYYNNGLKLFKKTRQKEALVQLDQAIKLDPACAEFYFKRGETLLDLDKLGEAYNDFTKCVSLEPRNYVAFKRRSRVHYERGKVAESIADLQRAENVCTNKIDRAEIIKQQAKMHATLNQHSLAIGALTRTLALERSANAFLIRANQYMKMREYKKAIADYSAAIDLNEPKYQDRLFSMRADAYEKIGRFDLAKKDRKSAKALVDDSWGGVLQDMDKQTKL